MRDGTLTALTSGLLLGLHSADLKPLLESRPELAESLSHSAAKLQQFIAMFDRVRDSAGRDRTARSFVANQEFLPSDYRGPVLIFDDSEVTAHGADH